MNKKENKNLYGDEKCISIVPMNGTGNSKENNPMLDLQLMMATSSINHEYARIEFEDTLEADRKEELLEYMNDCRKQYFEARESLTTIDENSVLEFEEDLSRQKKMILTHYNA